VADAMIEARARYAVVIFRTVWGMDSKQKSGEQVMNAQSFKQRLLSGVLVLGVVMGGTAALALREAHAGVRQANLYNEDLSFKTGTAAGVRQAADRRCRQRAQAEGYQTGALVQIKTDVPNFVYFINHPNQVFHQTVTCVAQTNT
jgi:hypothetical protein